MSPSHMSPADLLAVLRDPERCPRDATGLVAEMALPAEAWPWLVRHAPFGSWLEHVARTPAPPGDPIIWEHVLRHLPEGPSHMAALTTAVRSVPDQEVAAEVWRELGHHDPEQAAQALLDLSPERRGRITVAGPRPTRWRPLCLRDRLPPPELKYAGQATRWVTDAERAEHVIAAVDVRVGAELIIEWAHTWPREALTEAVITVLISGTTRAGRALLWRAKEEGDVPLAWAVLSWCLDAWRGWHHMANTQVTDLVVELTGDALAMAAVPHGTRLWRDLRDVATMRGTRAAKDFALWTVLCHAEVDAGDLAWLDGAKERLPEEWASALARHPHRHPLQSSGGR